MRFAATACVALAALALAACTGGITSPGDVARALTVVTPIQAGTYDIIPSDKEAKVAITRHGKDYRLADPAGSGKPLTFRVLAMPDLARTRYLIQADDPDKKTGKLTYHYYFAIIGADQIVVLTPSRHDLEQANLSDEMKALIEVKGGDEVFVKSAGDTLAALKRLISEKFDLEVIMQLARRS